MRSASVERMGFDNHVRSAEAPSCQHSVAPSNPHKAPEGVGVRLGVRGGRATYAHGSTGPAADSAEELGEADPRRDPEFAVAGREVDLDGLGGHEQGLGDVAVALPLGREPGYPALAG